MTWISVIIVAILLIVEPMNQWLASEAQAAETDRTISPAYFGLHIHRIVQTQPWYPNGDKVTPWPSIKFGSWRLWDAYVAWPNLEPERGKWNFQTLDKYIALAERAGIDVVLPLGFSPTWASTRPNESPDWLPGHAAEPRNIDDWRNYVRTVALRYKGRIKYYELWNEVNVPEYYSGSKEKLVELAQVAYKVLKEIDPDIVFLSPSVVADPAWLDEYLAKGGAQYLDVLSYHFYVPKASPEAMLPVIRQVQSVMRKHRLENKPLWNTEIGWWIDNKTVLRRQVGAAPDWRKLDDRLAAAYVARTLILSWPAGVSRVFWYAWDGIDMGLIEPGLLELKPAALAFDIMARWVTGGVLKQCNRDDRIWTCPLVRADGKAGWIIWTEDDVDRKWNIPAAWNITRTETIDGSFSTSNGKSIWIGAIPILLTSDNAKGITNR
jgi:hypothetical protein